MPESLRLIGLLDELHRRRATRARCGRSQADAGVLPRSSRRSSWRRSLVPALVPRRVRVDAALRATRRSSSLLALVGLAVMVVGFPEGAPLRRGRDVHLQPRRGGPVPAHDLQGGAARGARPRRPRRRSACTALRARRCGARGGRGGRRRSSRVACWPLARGGGARPPARRCRTACPPRGAPSRATSTARCRRRARDGRCRASSSPTTTGAGRTTRSCPALTDRPVAVRSIVPYADLRAVDLQWTTDALVEPAPRRARPARGRCST